MSICITLHLIFIHYTLLVVELFFVFCLFMTSSKGRGFEKMSLSFGKASGKAKKVNGEE